MSVLVDRSLADRLSNVCQISAIENDYYGSDRLQQSNYGDVLIDYDWHHEHATGQRRRTSAILFPKDHMKKIVFVAYLVSLHIVLGLLLVNTFFFQPDEVESPSGISETQPAPASSPPPELTEHYYRTLKYHRIMDGSVASGSMVFIGDSFVQGLWVTAISPQSVNYGIGGDTTAGVLKRIPEYKSIEHAALVVIAVGLNDMEFRNNDEIVENYQKIANSIPENIPVVFSAVLPINEDVRKELQGRNKQIRSLNMKLKKLCGISRRFSFIDIGPRLIDKDGNLNLSFSDGGVHLNPKGNEIWIGELRKATKSWLRKKRQAFK